MKIRVWKYRSGSLRWAMDYVEGCKEWYKTKREAIARAHYLFGLAGLTPKVEKLESGIVELTGTHQIK